jgi:hypothetical protein
MSVGVFRYRICSNVHSSTWQHRTVLLPVDKNKNNHKCMWREVYYVFILLAKNVLRTQYVKERVIVRL